MEDKIDLSQLRNLVRQYIDSHLYDTAMYWADKVCSLSDNEPQDVIWLANAMYHTKQYRRGILTLRAKEGLGNNLEARYLTAKCFAALQEWDEVLETIGVAGDSTTKVMSNTSDADVIKSDISGSNRKVESALFFLRGKAYESHGMKYRELAVEAYKEALMLDVYCFEAFDALVSHYMLTSQEETDLVNSLPIKDQCSPTEAELVRYLYSSTINKYSKPIESKLSPALAPVSENFDIVVCTAEKHFNNFDYATCFDIVSGVMLKSPLHEKCTPLYIACLFEMKKKILLFDLAERLVKNYPSKPMSWYCIGTYYLLIGKNEAARRFFSKATALNHIFAPAWLGFAHSYANEGEHDQAISAYFTASKLMPGSHLPFLYLGLEYVVTHNITLAKRYFHEALVIAPDDPHVRHELGTLAYHCGEYKTAKMHYEAALQKVSLVCGKCIPDVWEPLFNDLGHVSRKLGEYESALMYHRKALQICPQSYSTFSSIGLVQCYLNDFCGATASLHRALSIKRDDILSSALLGQVLEADPGDVLFPESISQEKVHGCMDESSISRSESVSMELEESFTS